MPARLFLLSGLLLLASPLVGRVQPPAPTPLDGVWEITAMIDNGQVLSPAAIRDKLVKDARFTISGQTITFTRPGSKEKRDLLFVVNNQVHPRTIDLANTEQLGGKGIYSLQGDSMFLCLAGPDSQERPTEFQSREGSQSVLMVLKRATTPPATAVPAAPPAARGSPGTPASDYRSQLVGTWGHQDDEKVEYATLNADGTFSWTRTWKHTFHRIFQQNVRASGAWRVEGSSVVFTVTASTDSEMQNQVYTYRISSLTSSDVVYLTQDGQARREWRVR